MTKLTIRGRSKWLVSAGVLAVIAIGAVGSTEAAAGGVPELIEKVIALVTSLQADVAVIKSDTAAIRTPSQATTLFTGKVIFRSGVLDCALVNVVNQPRSVLIQVINGSTGVVATQDAGTVPVQPGISRSIGIASSFGTGSFYCKFTVLNGVASDIRANLLLGGSLANDTTLLATAAQ